MAYLLIVLLACASALAQAPPATEEVPEPEVRPLVVAISPFAPFVETDHDPPEGFSIEVWQALARELGRDFEYRVLDNVSAKLDAVANDEVDAAIGGITITLAREQHVDFTLPVFRSGLDILIHSDETGLSMRSVTRAMTPARLAIILGFLALIVISGHLVWWAEQGQDEFHDDYFPGVLEGMYWAIVTASTVGYGDKAPVRWAGRAVAALVIVISLPMFAIFTAELASTLTLATLDSSIEGPDDLSGRIVGVVENTSGADAVSRLDAHLVAFPDVDRAVDALKAKEVDAVVHDAPNLQEIHRTRSRGELVLVGELFTPQRYGIAVPTGSDLREELNRALLAVRERGEWTRIQGRWFSDDLGH